MILFNFSSLLASSSIFCSCSSSKSKIPFLAFSKKVLMLEGKDISNSMVLDGYYEYITIYDNKKEIRIGGSNPSNKYFDKLERMLNDIKNER